MVKLVVAYSQPEDPGALDRYYADTHIPLVDKIPNPDQRCVLGWQRRGVSVACARSTRP